MDLEDAIRKYYKLACDIQREITSDNTMKSIMQGRDMFDRPYAMKWMEGYGLFQGIPNQTRNKVLAAVSKCLPTIIDKPIAANRATAVAAKFETLFTALYHVKRRMWISATSKLLWCSFPDDIVIYDSFVERFVIVMQWFDDELIGLPRLGNKPSLRSKTAIRDATQYYMDYQGMVYRLFQKHASLFRQLRMASNEQYPHDIRILDKILWITANRNEPPRPASGSVTSVATVPGSIPNAATASVPVVPVVTQPTGMSMITKHINKLQSARLGRVLEQLRCIIKGIGGNITEYGTQDYIGYKCLNGRPFASIHVFRDHILFTAHEVLPSGKLSTAKYRRITIRTGREDYCAILEIARSSFENLGGTLK